MQKRLKRNTLVCILMCVSLSTSNDLIVNNKQQVFIKSLFRSLCHHCLHTERFPGVRPNGRPPTGRGLGRRLFVWLLYTSPRVMVSDVFAHNCHFSVKSIPQMRRNSNARQKSHERSQRLWKSNPKARAYNLSAYFQLHFI